MGEPDGRDWLDDLLARYEGPLLRYVARLTGDGERARDIVQDAFVRLVRERPGVIENHTAEWLYAVCRNRAIDVYRKERRMRPMVMVESETSPGAASPAPSPAEAVEQRDSASVVLRMVAELPENQQEVVRLKFQDGLSYKEIAGVTGLSVSNVGFLIHTAIRTLRTRLDAGSADARPARKGMS